MNEAAKLARRVGQRAPDENTSYYVGKLRELYEKFRPLVERDGLVPVIADAIPSRPGRAASIPLSGSPTR